MPLTEVLAEAERRAASAFQPAKGERAGRSGTLFGLTARELGGAAAGGVREHQPRDRRGIVRHQRTAATHVTHILGKLGVESRVEAAAWAVRHGLA